MLSMRASRGQRWCGGVRPYGAALGSGEERGGADEGRIGQAGRDYRQVA